MNRNLVNAALMLLTPIVMGVTACTSTIPSTATTAESDFSTGFPPGEATPLKEASEDSVQESSSTKVIPVTGHLMSPGTAIRGRLIPDVVSFGTSAFSGDSYKINRFERPFLKDMTYVPDLDIISFNTGADADWYYVSIELNGDDPNNSLGINYGVEIDVNADGFGDYLIWAHPPYKAQWDLSTIQVFKDSNKDSAGLSGKQSDAVFDGNGYDKLFFDGSRTENSDPDLAWVRMQEEQHATIQFAFKKAWLGFAFMVGAVSDAGPKEVTEFDYADHFKEADAGSPIRGSQYFPLKSLYAVDNTCWEAYGIQLPVVQPKFCPIHLLPTATPKLLPTKSPTLLLATNEASATEPPDVTASPDVTELPVVTEPPAETEPPVVTEPPAETEPPVVTEPPAETEPPPAETEPPPAETEPPPPAATDAPVVP